jgi:23S rRNA pseudouridine2605 synthase
MNNETSNPMPESAAASPEAEPVKKTRKPRAAKADGAKDAAEAKSLPHRASALASKRCCCRGQACAQARDQARAEEPVAVEEPTQPVAEQELQSQDHDAADAVVADVPWTVLPLPVSPRDARVRTSTLPM